MPDIKFYKKLSTSKLVIPEAVGSLIENAL